MFSVKDFWNNYSLKKNTVYQWQAGQTKLRFRQKYSDLLIEQSTASSPDESVPFSVEQVNDIEGIPWKRWLLAEPPAKIDFKPMMPNRPIVVKTDQLWTLPPGLTTSFYVSIPLSIKVAVTVGDKSLDILEVPSNTLSNTWFGDFFEGELCYAVKTKATRSLENQPKLPNRAICIFNVHNKTEQPLPVQKICVRTKYLNIYSGKTALWTNSIQVTAEGEDQPSRLKYETEAPVIEGESQLKLVQEANEKTHETFFRKTFGNPLSLF